MLSAAVIVPIVRYAEPKLVFVRRAAHLRRNPGQIGFPGGIAEPGDPDMAATALREFEEELGIPRERVRLGERLDDVVTLALSVTVTPYVAFIEPPVTYVPDGREIAGVLEVPLEAVFAPGALVCGSERVERDGLRYDVPTWLFDYDSLHVWGATARMLRGLATRYDSARHLLSDQRRVP